MGAKDSKPSCISYEDAVKRITDSELRRLKETFKRSAGSSGTILSKNAFLLDGLPEGIPPALADALYTACGGTQKGITFKDVLCGLVLLTKGTQDEKIKFLWNIYSNDSNTYITKSEFTKQLQLESIHQPTISSIIQNNTQTNQPQQLSINDSTSPEQIPSPSIQQSILLLFNPLSGSSSSSTDRISFDQFKSFIITYPDSTVLSKWLLIGVSVGPEKKTPTFYQSLAGVTHLEEQDISDLEKVFWILKGVAYTKQLDIESLAPLICPPVPRSALRGVFLAFDENRDGHIDFKELCCGVSAACRGPTVERSKFCFKVFDIDRDRILSFNEIKEMINILIFVAKENSNSNNFKTIDFDQVLNDLYRHRRLNHEETMTIDDEQHKNNDNDNIVDDNTKSDAVVGGGSGRSSTTKEIQPFNVTQEDFLMWSVQSSLNLVQPFLNLLFEVCHIVLGLRAQCRHLEYEIVKGWKARELSRGYTIGNFWYLISADWYQNWQHYTQALPSTSSSSSSSSSTTTTGSCTFCKMTTNYNSNNINNGNSNTNQRNNIQNGVGVGGGNVDEAVVCDESFTSNSTESMGDLLGTADSSSLGSGSSSGISCGGSRNSSPGPIDNTHLIAPPLHKNVQTLTNEGGRLKRDVLLTEHQDYELVPESLWKALSQWYTNPLPLRRQVIQSTHMGSQIELELYPLNLRILKHQMAAPLAQSVSSWGTVAGGYGFGTYSSTSNNSTSTPQHQHHHQQQQQQVLQTPKRYLAYTAAFSKLATVKQMADFLCQRLKLKLEDVRLWHVYTIGDEACLLEEECMTLQELSIKDNDQILLEIRNKDLTWPEELGSLAFNASGASGGSSSSSGAGATASYNYGHQERRATVASIQSVHAPGATGLHNLGNTCFMNAALQVLFNTKPLTQYFNQDMHRYDLNTKNKLGTKGQLAVLYSELLKEVWTASTRSVAPLKLRFCVIKYAQQFAGGGQHDSQELLEWFLDTLHEDLNRVTESPYSELKDSNGRADLVVATEAWAQHHARNQSIIIDLFYGQLKSKVSCLACGRDSVRFDPFSLLSLPLPVENYTYCEVLVILLDGSIPIKYGVRLNSDSKYYDLKQELSKLCNLPANMMLICEIYNSQIRCTLLDEYKVKDSTATELYVYEIPKGGSWKHHVRNGSDLGCVTIEKGLKDIQRNSALLMSSTELTRNQLIHMNSMSSTAYTTADDQMGGVVGAAITNSQMTINSQSAAAAAATNSNRTSKHSTTELSTSPESTFVQMHRKRSIAANLLNPENTSASSSLDEHTDFDDDYHVMNGGGGGGGGGGCRHPHKIDIYLNNNINNNNHNNNNGGDDDIDDNCDDDCDGDTHHNINKKALDNCICKNNNNNNNNNDNDMENEKKTTINNLLCDKKNNVPLNKINNNNNNNSNCDNLTSAINNNNNKKIGNNNNNNSINNSNNKNESGGNNNNYCDKTTTTTATNIFYQQNKGNGGYLIAVHRKLSRQDTYFLSYHKTKPSLFGVPLLIPCYEGGSNKDLYCAVWIQVARLLSPLPPTPPDQANHATDCDDSLGYDFPFKLRGVCEGGRICAKCPWTAFCRGCEIPCDDDQFLKGFFLSANSSNSSTPKLSVRDSSINSISSQQQQQPHHTNNNQTQQQFTSTLNRKLNGSNSNDQSKVKFYNENGGNTTSMQIAIDWDPTALHLRYQSTRERIWTDHESVNICRKQQTEPVDLNHCLRAFTSEEKLEQSYYCAHCKGKKEATKKLQIWKLPPILIIHLKRFNLVNNKWVKSQKVVNFPFKDFDPTPYLASVPQETILRHRDLLERHGYGTINGNSNIPSIDEHTTTTTTTTKNMYNSECENEIEQFDRDNNFIDNCIHENDIAETNTSTTIATNTNTSTTIESTLPIQDTIPNIPNYKKNIAETSMRKLHDKSIMASTTLQSQSQSTASNSIASSTIKNHMPTKRIPQTMSLERRKRLISTSLATSPVIDGQFTDFHEHKLKEGEDPFDLKYQLYAVVSHSGMLNGGHYISYAANPNNSWYCYNDSSCREISSNQPNIDPGSAYLLFYERQGLHYEPYLSNVIKRNNIPNNPIIDTDETDGDFRNKCVLS